MTPLLRTEEEKLEVEHFLRGIAVGLLSLAVLSFLAILVPVIGFNAFLLFVIVPYYSGYLAGKRTDSGVIAGFVLGVIWTAVEVLMLFIIGNRLAITGRARITSMLEVAILFLLLLSNTFFCAYGGRIGTQKRILYRRVPDTPERPRVKMEPPPQNPPETTPAVPGGTEPPPPPIP
ncbi:MAG: hypothetical protein J7L61_04500 [Thermoplasmata archaeon]|nr:hypothetical protein [Thermoplasmata archaeon]